MQRIRTNILPIISLSLFVLNGLLNTAHGADGIKIFANGQTEKIFYTHAYQKDGTWYTNLYAMNPDGTEPTQVTDFYPAYASESSVSADGQYLYFTSNYQSYRSYNYEDIFRLEFNGLKLTRITGDEKVSADKTGNLAPQISNGTDIEMSAEQISISYQGSSTYHNLAEIIDSKVQKIEGVPATKIWVKALKDKFVGDVGYVTVQPGQTAVLDLVLGDGNYLAYSPTCSSDGTKIAGISGHAFYDKDLKDKGPNIVLSNLTIWDNSGKMLDQQQTSTAGDAYPEYSPDGTKIAYTRGTVGQDSVVVVASNNINGTPKVIAEGGFDTGTVKSFGYSNPAWSPDGTKIACSYAVSSSGGMTGNIMLLNSDGSGNKTQLTNVDKNAIAVQPAFSPDGQWITYALVTSKGSILYVTDIITHNFTANIFKQSISGGEPVQLTTDDAAGEPNWGTIGQVTPPGDTTTTVPGEEECPEDWPIPCGGGNGDCCSPDYPSCCSKQNPLLIKMCCPADFPYCGRLGRKCYKDPPGICALSVVAQGDHDVLKKLYRLRDTILRHTDKGKQYKALYYKHSPEFIKILNEDAALMEQAENVLYWMLPDIESFTASRKITMTQDMLQEMLRLCDSISKKASPDLKQTITLIEKDLRQGQIFDDLVKFDPVVLLKKQPESVEPKSRFLKTSNSASP